LEIDGKLGSKADRSSGRQQGAQLSTLGHSQSRAWEVEVGAVRFRTMR